MANKSTKRSISDYKMHRPYISAEEVKRNFLIRKLEINNKFKAFLLSWKTQKKLLVAGFK